MADGSGDGTLKEQHYRSVVKGASWRIVGTLDTMFLSWIITGRAITALKIGGIEVFTKIFLFYVHERVWLRCDFGRRHEDLGDGTSRKRDEHHLSLIKGISWRAFGTIDTIVIAFFITGDYTKAFSIGLAEVFTKVFLYYVHERVWHRIAFGAHPQHVPRDL